MHDDVAQLLQLNQQIGTAESAGDRAWLDRVLATHLAFQRANGAIVDRRGFLDAVAPSPARSLHIDAIRVHGARALVDGIVTQQLPDGEARVHNLRLFVREAGTWKLLGWANERI